MRETGSSSPGLRSSGDHAITISGTGKEIERLRAMLNGTIWLTTKGEGKIEVGERFKPVPAPEDDPLVPPQWQSEFGSVPAKWAPEVREMAPVNEEGWHMPSFFMSHIFNVKVNIPRLQSWGFECLRGRRGNDGKFWEVWYLPGEWAAQGELADFIKGVPDKLGRKYSAPEDCLRCQNDWRNGVGRRENSIDYCRKRDFCPHGVCADFQAAKGLDKKLPWSKRTEAICHWLADRVCFGTLDVAIQRMALANPD